MAKLPLIKVDTAGSPAALRIYVLHRPDAHPMWHSYVLSLIHLRPIDGMPPPHLEHRDSSHELSLFALDPRAPLEASKPETYRLLHPVNLLHQLRRVTDERAGALCDAFAKAIDEGAVNPDTDWRRAQLFWLNRWLLAS